MQDDTGRAAARTRLPRGILAMALLWTALSALPLAADENAATTPDEVLATATHYLETLYSFDWQAVRELLADDMVFEDPTATYFGGAWRTEDPDRFVEIFRRASEGITSSTFEIVRQFAVGERAILTVVYEARGDGGVVGAPGVDLVLRTPAVTVVQVRDGKIVHHLDHVDYVTMMAQVEEQKAAQAGQAAEPTENGR